MDPNRDVVPRCLTDILDKLLSDQSSVRSVGENFLRDKGSVTGCLYALTAYACTGKDQFEALQIFCSPADTQNAQEIDLAAACDLACNDADSDSAFAEDFDHSALVAGCKSLSSFAEDVNARRTLAAVLAKRVVRERWISVIETEKNAVKTLLLHYVVRLPSFVRRTLYVVIAHIAAMDGPTEGWPVLFPTVRHIMHQSREKHITDGMAALLDLLLSMAEEPGTTLAYQILYPEQGLQEALLHLAQGMPQFNFTKQSQEATVPEPCRRKCLRIYQLCTRSIIDHGTLAQVEALIIPTLSKWTSVFLGFIDELAATSTDLNVIQSTLIVFRCLSTFFSVRAPALERECSACLRIALEKSLEVLDAYYPFYQNMVINDHDGDASVEESIEGGPTSFVIQLCELFAICASRTRLRNTLVKGHIKDILGAVVKYFQINEAQKAVWLRDGNEFLFHELEGGHLELSTRVAGEALINELFEYFYEETTEVLIESTMALFTYAEDRTGRGEQPTCDIWKFYELGLWLMGLVASTDNWEVLYSRHELEATVLRVGKALGNLSSPPLLRARALLTVTKFRGFLTLRYPNDIVNLLLVSSTAIQPSETPPVRIAACRALDAFLEACPSKEVKLSLMLQRNVLESVADFLSSAEGDSLRIGLELITRLSLECSRAMEAVQDSFLPLVIEIWRRSSDNPVVNTYFQEFLVTACQTSDTLREALQAQLLPLIQKTIKSIALTDHESEKYEPHNLSVSLDLYSVLIRTASTPLHPLLWEGFEYLMMVLMKIDEASVVQTGCETLALLLITASSHIRDENRLPDILVFAERLLSPGLEDRAALMAGPLLQVFIRQFGADLPADLIRRIFSAMLTRMVTAEVPALQQSLMVVLSRFVCQSPDQMFAILDSIFITCDGQRLSGFTVLVTFWLRWVPTADYILRNHYARNVTYLALLNVITRQSQKGELSTLPPSFVYDTVRLLIHGLRTLCHRNRHHRSCHPGKVPPQTTMDDATTSDVSSSSSKEKKTGENFDFFQNKSLGTDDVLCIAEQPLIFNSPTKSSDGSAISDDNTDASETPSSLCSANNASLLRRKGYRSVFTEEEEKDRFHSMDIKSLIYGQLEILQNSHETLYSNIFQTLDPPTRHAWNCCRSRLRGTPSVITTFPYLSSPPSHLVTESPIL